ncbi:hypothetical protein LWM68_27160 [Niabella sp. W65]|nr:hypothetical protein [Niabella sp. W65]MCH7366124.1 hypothetical protein [Niabella sp. W65]ULT41851.1 hypothetical protein KRR40_46070 [Niabella sp. I65]
MLPQPLPFEEELLAWGVINKMEVAGDTIHFSSSSDITARLVKVFVEKGFEVIGVQRKEYGLEDIYQKYFENNSTEATANEKSDGFIKKSFFKSGNPGKAVQHKAKSAFWVMVSKEMADHIHSWRFIVLFVLIVLTFLHLCMYRSVTLNRRWVIPATPIIFFYTLNY